MQKYTRVERKKEEEEVPIGKNEIRVTQRGKVGGYIAYGHRIFEEKNSVVILKGLGNAISKCITVSEILKRTIPDLHQITRVGTMETVDVYEPTEEGLDVVETTRHLPTITITLSKDPLDVTDPGYQKPLPETLIRQVKHPSNESGRGRGRGGRRGYGGRQEGTKREQHENETEGEHTKKGPAKKTTEHENGEAGKEGSEDEKPESNGKNGKRSNYRNGRGRRRGRGGHGRGAYSNRRDEE